MAKVAGGLDVRAEPATRQPLLETIAVEAGRFALAQPEDVGRDQAQRYEGAAHGGHQRHLERDKQDEEHGDGRAEAAHEPPEKVSLQTPRPTGGVGSGVGVGEAKFRFHGGSGRWGGLEAADADGAVRVEAEDFVEREHDGRSRRDDCAADDGHLALVHVAPPNRKPAINHRRDAKHEPEHHDHGETVADARLQVGRVEPDALREGGYALEREQRGHGEDESHPRQPVFCELYFHVVFSILSLVRSADLPLNLRASIAEENQSAV